MYRPADLVQLAAGVQGAWSGPFANTAGDAVLMSGCLGLDEINRLTWAEPRVGGACGLSILLIECLDRSIWAFLAVTFWAASAPPSCLT